MKLKPWPLGYGKGCTGRERRRYPRTSSVVSSGSSACTSALVIRFAFWGAVHAALRKSFGGSGSSYGNEPIVNSAEGGGGVGGMILNVIHSLNHILPLRRACWTTADGMVISMHGDAGPDVGLGGEWQIGGGELGDTCVAITARVAESMEIGRVWEA